MLGTAVKIQLVPVTNSYCFQIISKFPTFAFLRISRAESKFINLLLSISLHNISHQCADTEHGKDLPSSERLYLQIQNDASKALILFCGP